MSLLRFAGLLGGVFCAGCAPERPANLVLVSIDTLAPARTSAYDRERDTTPVLAEIAARGVRFDDAYSPSPWTLPAHAALLSGRYPSSLAPDPNDLRLYSAAPSLAERFRSAGYRTAAFTGGGFVGEGFGADAGFEHFEHGGPERAVAWIETLAGRLEESAAAQRSEGTRVRRPRAQNHPEPERERVVSARPGATRDAAPFFLFYHTYEAHTPYRDRRYVQDLDAGRLGDVFTDDPRSKQLELEICCEGFEPTEAERAFLLALYDGGVARADEQLGAIWSALGRLGLLESTAVVVTSDHGEEFWEHTGRGAYHGHTLYDELLRVPLVWYEPGLPKPGRTSEAPVSLVDVAPTLIARFGLGGAAGADGRDLSPILEDQTWDAETPLFAEAVRYGPRRVSARTERGKLILVLDPAQRGERLWGPVPVRARRELYLPDDPLEQDNVAAAHEDLVVELGGHIEARRATAATEPPPGRIGPLDAETRAGLRALGYLRDAEGGFP